jgi:hypothetical protein
MPEASYGTRNDSDVSVKAGVENALGVLNNKQDALAGKEKTAKGSSSKKEKKEKKDKKQLKPLSMSMTSSSSNPATPSVVTPTRKSERESGGGGYQQQAEKENGSDTHNSNSNSKQRCLGRQCQLSLVLSPGGIHRIQEEARRAAAIFHLKY